MRLDLLLNALVATAVVRGTIQVRSDGTHWRPIVHAEDIARAILAALAAPEDAVFNQIFNVGHGNHNYRIRDLAQIVADAVPGCRLEFTTQPEPDQQSHRIRFDRIARTLPDFRAEWDARRGAEQLYESYRKAGLTEADLDGARYRRVAHLRSAQALGLLDGDLRRVAVSAGAMPGALVSPPAMEVTTPLS
jgi:nucleoside-diphosphate-sugar epimerase